MRKMPVSCTTVSIGACLLAQAAFAQVMLGLAPGQNASSLREHSDEAFTFVCPPTEGSKSNVFGTDTYTDDSAICAAAIHAGALQASQAGIVTIRIGDGAKTFPGSKRNGIVSRTYGAWPRSYTFEAGEKPGAIGWSTVWNGIPMDFWEPIAVRCPTGGKTQWTIWGTDVYARDSSICVAAVHGGLITTEKGGSVAVKRAPGVKEFTGSIRNSIESKRWGGLEDAFVVASVGTAELPPLPPPPPPEEPPPPPPASIGPRTIHLAAITGSGPVSTSDPVAARTIALTGFTGIGSSSSSTQNIAPRTMQIPGWSGAGSAAP